MSEQPRLAGKTALITGASRGIGLAIAQRLLDDGATVCITGRNEQALEAAVDDLGGRGHAIGMPGKADDPTHIGATVARTLEVFGSVDILVNNAGINPSNGPLTALDAGAARKILEVNVIAALEWTTATYESWLADHGGSVVNIASVAGLRPAPGLGFYGVSKAALIHLTQELALELGPEVRVNAVAPAVVKTQFSKILYEGREEQVVATYPLRRLGVPEDIGSVVAFLAGEDSAWMTGQTLTVDGGMLLTGGI
ncbi:MAG: SDR family oxidoreductase [Nostocoides sp.]